MPTTPYVVRLFQAVERNSAHATLMTGRLRLQPMRRSDREALHALATQADVRRYLFDERILSRDDVQRMLLDHARHFIGCGSGLWSIRRHDDAPLLGFVRLWPLQIERDARPHTGLGFALDQTQQEQGYATEACTALIGYARDALGMRCLHAGADPRNSAANRLLWRLGFNESVVVRGRAGPLRIFQREL